MLSYCLKCKKKKILGVLIQKFLHLVMVKRYDQSVLYAEVKNQNLLENKKQKNY